MQSEYIKAQKEEVLEPEIQLTVVTVCRNALADLKPTVESVLRQKAKGSISIEYVVVDGASTDGTPEWLAEQLAAGNIERYVSEPDCGIYDAMNKGINLARGHVLLFLNAADELTDADLSPCIQPILEGRTTAVAAVAEVYNENGTLGGIWKPNLDQMFFTIMCCHQAYFASAEAYRRLGGYDARSYKTAADSDMIDRIGAEVPTLAVEVVSSKFKLGGFSTNCDDKFRDEFIEFFCRGWEHVQKRCREDSDYCRLVAAHIFWHCRELGNWQVRWGRSIPGQLTKLSKVCRELAPLEDGMLRRGALRWLAACYLPALAQYGKAGTIARGITEMIYRFGRIPSTNRYAGVNRSAIRPPYKKWILHRLGIG